MRRVCEFILFGIASIDSSSFILFSVVLTYFSGFVYLLFLSSFSVSESLRFN